MAIDYSSFINLAGGFKGIKANTPLDARFVIEKEADIYGVPFPYIGCMIYAVEEDKFFIVKSIKNGYQDIVTEEVFATQPPGDEWVDWMIAPDALVKTYEEFKGGNCNCSFNFDSVQKLIDILYDINNGINAKNKIDELANMLQNQGGGNTGGDSGDNDDEPEEDEDPTVDYNIEPWNPNAYTNKQIALKMNQNTTEDIIGSNRWISIEGANHTIKNITINRNGQNEFYKIITLDNLPTRVIFDGGIYIEKVINMCNTSKVTDMSGMFNGCAALTALDVSNFDTSNVTNMERMFQQCNKLTSLDVSNFNTSNVTDMSSMFYACNNLTTLDVSNFNTSKVTDMYCMFTDCKVLTELDLSSFNTSNVTNMQSMFQNCQNLIFLDVSNWNTKNINIAEAYFMFSSCSSLELSNIVMNNCSQETIDKITEAYNTTR